MEQWQVGIVALSQNMRRKKGTSQMKKSKHELRFLEGLRTWVESGPKRNSYHKSMRTNEHTSELEKELAGKRASTSPSERVKERGPPR